MRSLFRLYSLHTLERESSEFFSSAAVTVRQIGLTQTNEVMKLLDQIRPHAVRLVDAWQIPDWQLDSSLGRSDGNVYPDLFRRASQENPVNDLVFDPYPWNENVLKNATPKSKL
jgi:acyl-CoA oxidase